jgi:outer membrane receptor protein involved in Fe transport
MFTFGINYINQIVNPGVTSINQLGTGSGQSIDTTISSKRLTHQINTYVADEFKIFKKVKFNTGVHISSYQTDGTNYVSFQPRILIDYNPVHNLSLKSSYTSMVQHLHLLSNTWSGNPSDMWVPSTSMVKPETANQFSAGLTYRLDNWYFIAEAYHKAMNRLIDYKEGSSYSSSNKGWEHMIEEGTGKVHGIECSVKKEQGIFSGLLSYSYSKSTRKFETINRGNEFPYTYDRTHQITTAIIYHLNRKLSFGANWVFATGQPVTIAESYVVDNLNLNRAGYYKYYRSVNHVRLPNYHRLDFSINYIKNHPKFNYKWSLGVYNAYNRKNPYSIYEADESLYINSLLGFTPFLTISLGFNTKRNE